MSRAATRSATAPARLGRERFGVYAVLLGLWASGVGWLAVHYGLPRRGPFGLTPSPLEPWCLALHGAFAFAALGLVGWLAARHVGPGWRTGRSRASGVAMAAGAGLLIVSGYSLYYVAGDAGRAIAVPLHWGVGLAMPLALLAHLRQRKRGSVARGRRLPGEAGSGSCNDGPYGRAS
jgi:hypothetical protein